MDAYAIGRILIRRWKLVVPAIALVIVVVFLISRQIAPTYEARTELLFLQSQPADEDTSFRPMGSVELRTYAGAATTIVTSSRSLEELEAQGHSTDFTFAVNDDGTLATLSVQASTEEQALSSTPAIVARLQEAVLDVQRAAGVPEVTEARLRPIDTPARAVPLDTDRQRVVLVLAALGFFGVVLGTVVLDGVSESRRRARAPSGEDPRATQPPGGERAPGDVAPAPSGEAAAAPPPPVLSQYQRSSGR